MTATAWRVAPLLRALLIAVLLVCVTGAAAAYAADHPRDRVIKDGRISESSGLAASLLHPGILWTHNDSGHPARVFAIARDGTTAATISVPGEEARDWEAITAVRAPARTGRAYLAVGDIGDNNYRHDESRIVVLPEPKNLVTQSIRAQRVIRFRYPGGPRNAEALLADPRNGRLYVVTKDFLSSQLYAVPTSAWPDRTSGVSNVVTLDLVASSSASLVTDGSFLPDGRMLLRNYGRMYLLDKPENATNGRLSPLRSVSLPDQEQGESLTVVDGGSARPMALIGSEGSRQPVIRLDLAALGMADRPSSRPASSSASAGSSAGSDGVTGASSGERSGDGRLPIAIAGNTWLGVGVAGAAIVLMVAGTVVLLARRH